MEEGSLISAIDSGQSDTVNVEIDAQRDFGAFIEDNEEARVGLANDRGELEFEVDDILSDDGYETDDEEINQIRQNVRRVVERENEIEDDYVDPEGDGLLFNEDERLSEFENEEFQYWDEANPPSPPQYNSDQEEEAEREGKNLPMEPTFPVFNPKTKADQVQLQLGMQFKDNIQFKNAVEDYSIINGYDVRYKRNAYNYCRLTCHGVSVENKRCEWSVSASWMQARSNFQIVRLGSDHICKRLLQKHPRLTAEWIARYYMERFMCTPSWKVRELKKTIWFELRLIASLHMCWKALAMCKYKMEGDFREQFKPLWDYAAEIKRANDNNTVYLKLREDSNVFHSIYICFDALKKGWKEGCRPVLGLDGCFLKGYLEGQILAAVGIDANNQMYPVAWAVVPRENEQTWTWFLQHLISDLALDSGQGFTILSDKQKGLINSIANLLPEAEHRCCARHVYANFRRKFDGIQYRTFFWAIVNATTRNMYEDRMNELREFDPKAAADLEGREPRQWCKAWFSLTPTCDVVTNNITEVWNGTIIEARRFPILSLLEELRKTPIKRMNVKRDMISKKDVVFCPRILNLLASREDEAAKWSCLYSGRQGYEVTCNSNPFSEKYIVNLNEKTCSCRSWQLSGIPCLHAIAAIWEIRDEPEKYVSDWYRKDAYMRSYDQYIEMLNGPNEWPRQGKPDVICPELKQWVGRPKRKRRLEAGETVGATSKLPKMGQTQICQHCGVTGHNRKACPNQGVSLPRGMRKPPGLGRFKRAKGRCARGGGRGREGDENFVEISSRGRGRAQRTILIEEDYLEGEEEEEEEEKAITWTFPCVPAQAN